MGRIRRNIFVKSSPRGPVPPQHPGTAATGSVELVPEFRTGSLGDDAGVGGAGRGPELPGVPEAAAARHRARRSLPPRQSLALRSRHRKEELTGQ
jgi:hypothetical protein